MKQALLIIDVQNDYFGGGRAELHNPLAALNNVEKLLTFFREEKREVIHVQHINTWEGASFFLPDTEGAEIHKNIQPRDGEFLVIKHAPNSFYGTDLEEIIKNAGITELVVCGMMSHMCIDTTVRACKDFGLKVILAEDACATKDLPWDGGIIPAETVHKTFMAALNGMFADVVKAEDFLRRN